MLDIAKCKGDDCPLKEKCHRYTDKGELLNQSYLMISPYKDGECDYFVDNKDKRKPDECI